eukprot:XP_003751775.2 PREDICTED: inter-alpha-trypsin inhibitor heavy chain H5 isoform X1 [Rattus norvegicus]
MERFSLQPQLFQLSENPSRSQRGRALRLRHAPAARAVPGVAPLLRVPGRGQIWDDTSEQVMLRVPRQLRLLQRLKTKPLMAEFSVKSTIISRYAFTTVSCRMLNRASEDQDAEFQMQIPESAFITNFTMLIGDNVYQSEITEKEKKSSDRIKEKRNRTTDDNE